MKRKTNELLRDIITSMQKIERYISNVSFDGFIDDEILKDAVIRNLEIIGEACGKIPKQIRDKLPSIPWDKMIALRNIAIHEYFDLELDVIWTIVTVNLPATKNELEIVRSTHVDEL